MTKEKKTVKETRKIDVIGDKIRYTLAIDGGVDILDYTETIYNILNQGCVSPFRDEGRLRFSVRKDGVQSKWYLYDLVMADSMGMLHLESYIEDMQRYYDLKRDVFEIDHADCNPHNNTRLNLSLMAGSLNRQKHKIAARFKPPYYLNSAYCGGEYRVQLICDVEHFYTVELMETVWNEIKKQGVTRLGFPSMMMPKASINFICKDAEDYVGCLKWLADISYSWCNPGQTPREYSKEHKELVYWAADIGKSIMMQNKLASLDRKAFQMWPVCEKLIMAE